MNLNDTSPENIKQVATIWSKSVNLIAQRPSRSDSERLKNNRTQAQEILRNVDLWEYLWKNNWSHDLDKSTRATIASWDMDQLIVPFAKHLLLKMEQDETQSPIMRPIQMEVLLRELLNGYRAKRSVKALELFLRKDGECGSDKFVNTRFAALLDTGHTQLAMDLIAKNIFPENQWKLMHNLFHTGAQWKNVIKNAKKMTKMGWDLNNMPAKDNIVGHILRTNRVFYANKDECQDLIKIGVRPTNLQVPCSQEFIEVYAEFEKTVIFTKIKQGSEPKTQRTKKM